MGVKGGLMVPTGYSLDLDGTALYLSISLLILAQAYERPPDLGQQLAALGGQGRRSRLRQVGAHPNLTNWGPHSLLLRAEPLTRL